MVFPPKEDPRSEDKIPLKSGVFWTKFEHCMSKIRRILMTDARAERVVARNPIVRSECLPTPTLRASHAPSGRVYKTKNFLTNPFSAGDPLKK
jgi:hypothetical protein